MKNKKKMNLLPLITGALKTVKVGTIFKDKSSAGHILLYILKAVIVYDYTQNGFTNINVILLVVSVVALVIINYIKARYGQDKP
jgi:uncharacterized membrane protein